MFVRLVGLEKIASASAGWGVCGAENQVPVASQPPNAKVCEPRRWIDGSLFAGVPAVDALAMCIRLEGHAKGKWVVSELLDHDY